MKFIIALSCLLVLAYANEDANVLRNDAEVNPTDFKYNWELDNSAKAQQQGHLEGENWIVDGSFGYSSPEGENVAVQYVANENGYQVLSANPPLPTPPPIPEAILRAIEYIRAHPSAESQN